MSLRAVLLHELGLAEKVLLDPAATGHLRESLELAEATSRRAVIAADLAELLVLAGNWEAGVAIVAAALDELAGYAEEPGDSLSSAIAHLQAWWARFAAYDPYLVGEFDHLLPELLDTARGRAAGPRTLAGLLAGVLAWRGEPAATVLGLLDHALDGNRLLAQVDSNPLIVAQAVFAAVWLEDPARAEELASELLALSRSRGSVSALSIAAYARAAIRSRRGELVGAETAVRAVIETAQEHGGTFAIAGTLYWAADALIERAGLADIAALATGIKLEPALARTATGAMLQEVLAGPRWPPDYPAARGELQAAAETYTALHQLSPGTCWRSALALALAGQDSGKALRLADSELEAARRTGSPRSAGIALRTRGMLQGGQRGLADLREAADVLRHRMRGWSTRGPWSSSAPRCCAPTSAPRRASHCAQGWTSPTGAAQDGSPIGQQPNCELPAPGHGARC